ncbi:hypothetical protein VTN02DRAFT_6058 [Thermoascus thermophilus]
MLTTMTMTMMMMILPRPRESQYGGYGSLQEEHASLSPQSIDRRRKKKNLFRRACAFAPAPARSHADVAQARPQHHASLDGQAGSWSCFSSSSRCPPSAPLLLILLLGLSLSPCCPPDARETFMSRSSSATAVFLSSVPAAVRSGDTSVWNERIGHIGL